MCQGARVRNKIQYTLEEYKLREKWRWKQPDPSWTSQASYVAIFCCQANCWAMLGPLNRPASWIIPLLLCTIYASLSVLIQGHIIKGWGQLLPLALQFRKGLLKWAIYNSFHFETFSLFISTAEVGPCRNYYWAHRSFCWFFSVCWMIVAFFQISRSVSCYGYSIC